MKANLKKYLQSLFMDAPRTPKNEALFEELYANLCDRYDELIAAGSTPDAAYAHVIGDLGDISPLLEGEEESTPPQSDGATPTGEKTTRSRLTPDRLWRAKLVRGAGLAIAVMLYIIWLVPTILFGWAWALFACAALGTVVLVLSCNLVPAFLDDSAVSYPEKMRRGYTLAANLLQAFGIGFCVLCVLPAALIENNWGAALMFATVALGVGMILLASGIRPKKDKSIKDSGLQPHVAVPQEGSAKLKKGWLVPLVIVVSVLVLLGVLAFCIDQFTWGFGIEWRNSDPSLYINAGDAAIAEPITGLDIEWEGGSILIETYDGDEIKIFETDNGAPVTDAEEQLHWYIDRGELRIRFDGKPRLVFRFGRQPQKALTIQIPQNQAPLTGISIENVAASIQLKNLTVSGKIAISTVSGENILYAVAAADAEIGSVSGNIEAVGSRFTELSVGTVSGIILLRDTETTALELESVSGNIALRNTIFSSLEVDTTSGSVNMSLVAPVASIRVDTTSGDIEIKLNDAISGFTAELDSVSGDIDCALSLSKQGDRYIYGDGSTLIKMDSVSGDLIIE